MAGCCSAFMDRIEDVLRGKRLVFLVGAPRSGTTWLQLLLSRSPAIVTAPETHIFSLFLRSMVDQWNRIQETGERIGLNQVLSEEEFRGLLRSTSGFVFAKIAQRGRRPPSSSKKRPTTSTAGARFWMRGRKRILSILFVIHAPSLHHCVLLHELGRRNGLLPTSLRIVRDGLRTSATAG